MVHRDKIRLSGLTGVSLPTIRKWLAEPRSVHRSIAYALRKGCEELDLSPEIKADAE